MSGHRRPLQAANWKMHLLRRDVESYCRAFAGLGEKLEEIVVFPSFPLLPILTAAVEEHGVPVEVGAQDLHHEEGGAFTGDVSALQIRDSGALWALCGHSERRQLHGEDDALIAAKVARAAGAGLTPVLCIGESLEARQGGQTEAIVSGQLDAVLGDTAPRSLVVAYEPVWAIGTGATATPELAQETHAFLRRRLAHWLGEAGAEATRILYGGSVKPTNCEALIEQPDIDGFLIGGASLDPGSFLDIIQRCRRQS